ncbi:MAG: HEAT repeat domain-containing protein [Anaerohalosphaeraceae bacterium]
MKTVRKLVVLFAFVLSLAAFSFADQVDDLIIQLKDTDPLVQCQAIEQLGQLKDKRAVEPLIALLSSDSSKITKTPVQTNTSVDPVAEKINTAKRACAGGDKHAAPTASTPPATLKQLIADIRTARNFIEKQNAVEALGATRDKRAVEPLLAVLKEEDFGQMHSKAIEALGEIGDPKVVPALLKYLPTESERNGASAAGRDTFTTKAAAAALAKIGDPRAAEPLYKAILTDPFLKHDGIELLVTLGGYEGVKYLNLLTKADDTFLKRDSQKALDDLGENHGLDPLIALLKDADPKVRGLAAAALTEIGDSAVESSVQDALAGLNEQDRKNIEAKLAQTQLTQSTAEYASSMQASVKVTAIEALGQITDVKAVRPLLAALRDSDENVCKAAGKALAAYQSKTVIRPIEMTLNTDDKTVIKQAIRDLGWIGSDYAVELIAKYTNDSFVNSDAVEALGNTGNPKALPYLEQAMESVFTEDEAMAALLKIKHPDTIKLFIKGLSAKSFVTRQQAVEALGQFNDPSIVEPLIELFKKNDHTVQDKVIQVLKKFKDPRIDSALAESLADPFQKEEILAILKERNWQPQTIREKVLYYSACEDWDKCAELGPEGADLLLAELKKNCSSGVAKALNKMGEARAYPVMLDCVKKWHGSADLLAGAEKTGWKPQTPEEQLIVANLKQDKAALKKLWNDPQGKEAFMKALNSDNLSAVTTIMHISIGMGLGEMVSPMIGRLNSITNETTAVSIANLFLSSGNQTLYSAAENWATGKGYEIHKFGFSAGSAWGQW